MKLKKYLTHSCFSGIFLGLLGMGAIQMAIGATCKDAQVSSCENVKFVLSPKKDCNKYYEVTADGLAQCMQKDDSHQCTTGTTKLKCTPPKAE